MKSIYRSEAGHAEIRAWCEERLQASGLAYQKRSLDTGLGDSQVFTFDGPGPTILAVPGTNFSTASWIEPISALAQNHRVVAVDLPGQPGLSSPDRHRHANDLYGVWLAQVVDQLELGQCVLVGHSLGARVALAASVHIRQAQGILALDPAGLARLRISNKLLLVSGRWFRRKDAASSRALLAMMMAPGASVPEHLVEWMTLVARHTKTTLAPPTLPPARLNQIDIPVRVVVGEHDIFLPEKRLRSATRKMTDTAISVVENAGHLMPLEHPQVVVDVVEHLLS